MYQLSFSISGMHCDACLKLITMKVNKIDGVSEFTLTPDGQASLRASRPIALSDIQMALHDLDYTVTAV